MSTTHSIRLITRQSPLALWQARYVQQQLLSNHPNVTVEIIGQTTQGDRVQHKPLNRIGGKDLFVKDLQRVLLNDGADIAVHSIKDLSVSNIPGLCLAAFCEREDPRDVFIANKYRSLEELPNRAVMGTSSPRRQCQLKSARPDIRIKPIRGNVGTRLAKLDADEYDGIILAAAGIKRLQLENNIQQFLDPTHFVPAIGQGIIGIECRSEDKATQLLLKSLDNHDARLCATTERAVNRHLGGDCFTPIAAHAVLKGEEIHCMAILGSLDGATVFRSEIKKHFTHAEQLGLDIAKDLLAQGAGTILTNHRH